MFYNDQNDWKWKDHDHNLIWLNFWENDLDRIGLNFLTSNFGRIWLHWFLCLSASDFHNAFLGFQSTYIILFQWIVSGLLGVGVDVLRAVDMESNMDIGVKSDMQEMVVGDVMEVLEQEDHVVLEDHVQHQV